MRAPQLALSTNTIKAYVSVEQYLGYLPSSFPLDCASLGCGKRREIGRYSAAYEWAIPFRSDRQRRGLRTSHSLLGLQNCALICERGGICRRERERAIHRFHLMQFSDAFSSMKIVTSPIDVRPSRCKFYKWDVLCGCKIKFCLKIMKFMDATWMPRNHYTKCQLELEGFIFPH